MRNIQVRPAARLFRGKPTPQYQQLKYYCAMYGLVKDGLLATGLTGRKNDDGESDEDGEEERGRGQTYDSPSDDSIRQLRQDGRRAKGDPGVYLRVSFARLVQIPELQELRL